MPQTFLVREQMAWHLLEVQARIEIAVVGPDAPDGGRLHVYGHDPLKSDFVPEISEGMNNKNNKR